ncbi:unnamed protein product [Nezara viridula]|uniref:Large ribosomal subunit protein uL30m n=1 Tax=Nezara viridula TaxID=85310 RepID=A0A9P0MRW5_NEZVI|nr:unnamed protein product [Nezara viridula]
MSFLSVLKGFKPFHLANAGLKSWTGAVKYETYTYYPRPGEEKDPPYEPTKLLMVQRIRPFRGNPKNHKKILYRIGLDGKCGEIAIVKNIPEICSMLYKIKHIIKVTPIRTPNGLPESDDLGAGYLKPNGEFIVSKRLNPDPERLRLTEEFQTDPARLDADTLIKDTRMKWINPWN